MAPDSNPNPSDAIGDLRHFAIEFARMVAALAVDPHGYFEKKYTARIERAQSEIEVRGVLTQLIQWAASSAVTDENRATLDRKLQQLGKPSVAELRLQFLP